MMSTTRPTGLRLAGFAATALGGLLVGLGSILGWATVTIGGAGGTTGLPPIDTKGIDTLEGKLALLSGVLVLVAIPAMRLARAVAGRRSWAILIIVAGLAATGLAAKDLSRPTDRFGDLGFEKVVKGISDTTGLPLQGLENRFRAQAKKLTHVSLGPGIYLVIAGGLLAAAGGGLGLAWANRTTSPPTAEPIEEAPGAAPG